MSTFWKPYELFYYEAGNRTTSRCVEEFASMRDLLERKKELKRTPGKNFVFPYEPVGSEVAV